MLARTYRLITVLQVLDAPDGQVITEEQDVKHTYRAVEGRDDLVLADLAPIGQQVLDDITAWEAKGPAAPTDL